MPAASLSSFEPADYAVIAASGLTAGVALAACVYTVPWRCCTRSGPAASSVGGSGSSPPKQATAQPPTRNFNVLWHGRAALSLLSAAWALSLLLRVSSIWGANSFLLPAGVRAWTGSGWMCRIYLTVSLGLLHPLCAFTTLLMLTAALSRRHRPEMLRHPNARLLGRALLCTLPVAAVQAVIAWLGLAVQYQGQQVEASPRSLLGYFFATYWRGSAQHCDSGSSNGSMPAGGVDAAAAAGDPAVVGGECTLCVFPAAAAIAHALFAAVFLLALCVTCSRLAAAVLNQRLKRRMRAFQAAYSLLLLLGTAAVGASVAWGPFSWANEACWLVFVACSLLAVVLVEWEVVVWPVRDLRAVDKRLVLWADALAAATAEQALDGRCSDGSTLGGFGSGSGSLIKAHGRSAHAEAYVHAAAAARTLSVASLQQQQLLPPQLSPHRPPLPLTLSVGSTGTSARPPLAWSPRRLLPPAVAVPAPAPAGGPPLAAVYTPASAVKPSPVRELVFP